MSLNGLNNTQFPLTLDGTTSLDVSSLTIDGTNVDLSNLVPYTGATQVVDLNSQPLRTTHVPATNPDVVNKQFLDTTINNLVISIAGSFLDKVTATPQTVLGDTTFLATLTSNSLVVPETKQADLGGAVQVSGNYRRNESDATVTANYRFGTITSSLGVYQATTTGDFATLGLATVTAGKRYTLTVNLLGELASYNCSLQLYASVDGQSPSQALGASVSFTPGSTIFQVLSQTSFTPSYPYLILLCVNSAPGGSGLTVKWFGLEVYETGVELEKVTLPLLGSSQIPIINDKKQLVGSGVSSTKVVYLDNVSSDIQVQLNSKLNLSGNNANQDIVLGGYKIQSTATPTVNADYTTKLYVDNEISGAGSLYVKKSGDSMTGTLSMGNNTVTTTRTPVSADDLTRKGYVDGQLANYLPLSGGTLSGTVIMGNNAITTTRTPISADDLTRKGYVDTQDAILQNQINLKADLSYVQAVDSSLQSQINSISGTFANYLPLTGGSLSGPLTLTDTSVNAGVMANRFYLSGRGDNQDGTGADADGPWYGLGNSGITGFTGVPCLAGFYGLALRSGLGYMVLTAAGGVGIGVTDALTHALRVNGTTLFDGNVSLGANVITSTTNPTTDDQLTRRGYVNTQLALKANLAGGNTFTGSQTYSDQTASRVAIFDASRNLVSSSVTTTTLGFLDATSSIQTQLNEKAPTSYVNAADALRVAKTGDSMSGSLLMTSTNVIEFGAGVVGKDGNAGKIGYETFTTGCLDVVGAGINNGDRRVRIWDKLGVGADPGTDNLRVNGTTLFDGNVSLGANMITSTTNPTTNDQLTRKGYVDTQIANYLPLGGGVLSGTLGITSNNIIDFGIGVTKEPNAGRIGYQRFTTGCLDIVGGGTTAGDRRVFIYDKLGVGVNPANANLQVSGTAVISSNVGIGTTNPQSLLHLNSVGTHQVRFQTSHVDNHYITAANDLFALNANLSLTGIPNTGRGSCQVILQTPTAGGFIQFMTGSAVNTVPSERMRVSGDGNLGIGSTTPRAKLDVAGDIITDWNSRRIGTQYLTNTSGYYLGMSMNAATRTLYLDAQSADAGGTSAVVIRTGGTPVERVSVSKDGLVSIGTAVLPSANSPGTTTLVNYGNACLYRNRLIFSSGLVDWNHCIYNNYLNNDNEGSWDGMKMNVFAGLWVRTGNAAGVVPTTSLFCNTAGSVGIGSTSLGSYKLLVNGTTALGGQVDTGVGGTTQYNIKFANSLSHIDGNAGEVYLFTAYQGHMAIGRNTNRDSSTANLVLGVAGTEESQLISVKSDNSAYMPMSFAASRYVFTSGYLGIGTTNPAVPLHVYRASGAAVGRFEMANTDSNYLTLNTNGTAGRMFIGMDSSTGTGLFGGGTAYMGWIGTPNNTAFGIATNNTERLRITSGGNVGIGTSTPTCKLDVRGICEFYGTATSSTSTNSYGLQHTDGTITVSTFVNGSAGGGWIGTKSNHNFYIYTNDSSAQTTFKTNGYVGIGTTNPSYLLHLSKSSTNNAESFLCLTNSYTFAFNTGQNLGSGISFNSQWAGDGLHGIIEMCKIDGRKESPANYGDSYLSFHTRYESDRLGGAGTLTEKMRITSTGNVGIGTTDPSSKFHLKDGWMRVDNGDISTCVYGPNTTWSARLRVGSGTSNYDSTTAQIISTNGTLHCDPGYGKDFYLGYYNDQASNLGTNFIYGDVQLRHKLTVGAGTSRTLMSVSGGGNGGAGLFGNIAAWPVNANGCLYTQDQPSGANSAGMFQGYNGANLAGYTNCLAPNVAWLTYFIYASDTQVFYNGALSAYTQAGGWVNVSDKREKEDIQDLKTESSLQRVLALKPKHYRRKFKEDSETPVPEKEKEKRHVGFIAQEVQESNPHCVSTWCKEEAKCEEDDGVRLGMSYNDYVVHLVGAVQEQQKHITVLEEREKVWVEYSRQQEKAFADFKAQTTAQVEKLAKLIQQLMPK